MPTDLWQFSEAIYTQPSVEAACLQLQAEGYDVCLLLCALWLERRHVAASPERVAQLQGIAASWQQRVVLPLRTLRQTWRSAAQHDAALNGLREQLKRLELNAEREQLQRLAACTEGWDSVTPSSTIDWLRAIAPHATDATLNDLRGAVHGDH